MRALAGCMAGVFTLGAAVQWNDPDPALWIAAYLAGAGIALAAALGRWLLWPSLLAAAVFGVAFAALAPGLLEAPGEAFTTFRMQAESHEEPREAVGLALLAGFCGWVAWRAGRGRSEAQASAGARSDSG